jgi:hypothetical protein
MPIFRDYAAAIAPVIDAVHVNVHAATRGADRSGLLVDLRYVLPLRPVPRARLRAVYRYGTAPDLHAEIGRHLAQGTLVEHDGVLSASAVGRAAIDALYAAHTAAVTRIWPDVRDLAALVGEVLATAPRAPGGALEVMAPPYEPDGVAGGVLLFNRLAALRYHRGDAHALAWQAEGLSAAEVVRLHAGPLWRTIEAATDEQAAVPYRGLTERRRAALYDGLRALV